MYNNYMLGQHGMYSCKFNDYTVTSWIVRLSQLANWLYSISNQLMFFIC